VFFWFICVVFFFKREKKLVSFLLSGLGNFRCSPRAGAPRQQPPPARPELSLGPRPKASACPLPAPLSFCFLTFLEAGGGFSSRFDLGHRLAWGSRAVPRAASSREGFWGLPAGPGRAPAALGPPAGCPAPRSVPQRLTSSFLCHSGP